MAPTNYTDIIELDEGHIAEAQSLSNEANWNQVTSDWSMMIANGDGIGIQDKKGRIIATALSLPYSKQFGWISMVIVTELWRKKGLATLLLKSCIERLEARGLVPVLDATPAGQNVYRPLGFVPHFGFERWEHNAVESICSKRPSNDSVRSTSKSDLTKIVQKDLQIFGGKRDFVIENLLRRSSQFSAIAKSNGGFVLGRDGNNATQIGPISANSSDLAIAMLDRSLAALSGPVFIDVCDHQKPFIERLIKLGFRRQRPFLRMAKRQTNYFGETEKMFALAGPELG